LTGACRGAQAGGVVYGECRAGADVVSQHRTGRLLRVAVAGERDPGSAPTAIFARRLRRGGEGEVD
jgi:hypothetical protein